MTEGLITIAYGAERYVAMAQSLSRSYRRYNEARPIAVISDEKNCGNLKSYFDVLIPVRRECGRGVVQKLHAHTYSPFDRTLFVDADCLFYRSPARLWDLYAHGDFSIRGWRYLTGHTEYERRHPYEWVEDTARFLHLNKITHLGHLNSGVFYFAKSGAASRVFETARSIYDRRESLGFVPFKNAPMNDEPAFAAAIELCGIEMDSWDSDKGMETFINVEKICEMNVLRGRARFCKGGVERNPTLVHFNVNAQYGILYGREMLRLEHEKRKWRSVYVGAELSAWVALSVVPRYAERLRGLKPRTLARKLQAAYRGPNPTRKNLVEK
jgi:hypothetical protein